MNLTNKYIIHKSGENIIDSGICSVCNSKYINSYRKDKKTTKYKPQ